MDLPSAFLVVRLLLRDTFRQSLASRLFWLLIGISGLCILLCLSIRIEGETARKPSGEIELFGGDRKPFTGLNRGAGYLTFAFGVVRAPILRDAEHTVGFLHALIALTAAGVGTLLLLLWSSGFLPEFLDPQSVAVLLAKPVPRWSLLLGKFLGVLLFAGLQVVLFVGGVWLALAVKTGIWHPALLFAIPLLILVFAILYSFSTVLAVWTRSTPVCIFGTLLFWAVCSGFNSAHLAAAGSEAASASPLVEAGYWILPKPTDCVVLMRELVQAEKHFRGVPGEDRLIVPELSLLTSLLFVAAMLALAERRFVRQDY